MIQLTHPQQEKVEFDHFLYEKRDQCYILLTQSISYKKIYIFCGGQIRILSLYMRTFLTTAAGTRNAIKTNKTNLLSYAIITYSPTRIRNRQTEKMSFLQETEPSSMETRQLHSSQKEAMKKMIEFSGECNELDIDEWLFDLNNLFLIMKFKDESKILETMGKLTGPALRWYQENLREDP